LERIPCEADAGREILERRVVIKGIAGNHFGVGKIAQIAEFSLHLREHRVHFIAHPQIEREVGANTEIVLKVSRDNRVALAADGIRAYKLRAELIRDVREDVADGAER